MVSLTEFIDWQVGRHVGLVLHWMGRVYTATLAFALALKRESHDSADWA